MSSKPDGWGSDPLSLTMDGARANSFATFEQYKLLYSKMVEVDGLFDRLFHDFRDPENVFGAVLAFRCHSALRAAAQLACSGQAPECFMVLRGALEAALYAYHGSTSDERANIWLHREDDEASRKACQREYTGRQIFPTLRDANADIGKVAGDLYERAIDYGAHPNTRGVLTSMTLKEHEDADHYDFAYLTGDPMTIQFAMKTWCQTAVCSLDVLSLIFPQRFSDLGLGTHLDRVRVGL